MFELWISIFDMEKKYNLDRQTLYILRSQTYSKGQGRYRDKSWPSGNNIFRHCKEMCAAHRKPPQDMFSRVEGSIKVCVLQHPSMNEACWDLSELSFYLFEITSIQQGNPKLNYQFLSNVDFCWQLFSIYDSWKQM